MVTFLKQQLVTKKQVVIKPEFKKRVKEKTRTGSYSVAHFTSPPKRSQTKSPHFYIFIFASLFPSFCSPKKPEDFSLRPINLELSLLYMESIRKQASKLREQVAKQQQVCSFFHHSFFSFSIYASRPISLVSNSFCLSPLFSLISVNNG